MTSISDRPHLRRLERNPHAGFLRMVAVAIV
jgi:hypothetical protein